LVSNAIRYNRPGGTVWIRARPQSDGFTILVEDTGIGVPVEHRERIFERFYRVDAHRSRQTGGTGLGLAIVKHQVQLMGGEVAFAPGAVEGSVFSLTLPRVSPLPTA
jgi:two-component system phosphate regulon sensor histidine kinase PhoR